MVGSVPIIGSLASMGCPDARLGRQSNRNCKAHLAESALAIDTFKTRRCSIGTS